MRKCKIKKMELGGGFSMQKPTLEYSKGYGVGAMTGTGALSGAGSGAALGTAVGGPIGTVVGAIGGGLIGGLSGLFGGLSKRKAGRDAELSQYQSEMRDYNLAKQSYADNLRNQDSMQLRDEKTSGYDVQSMYRFGGVLPKFLNGGKIPQNQAGGNTDKDPMPINKLVGVNNNNNNNNEIILDPNYVENSGERTLWDNTRDYVLKPVGGVLATYGAHKLIDSKFPGYADPVINTVKRPLGAVNKIRKLMWHPVEGTFLTSQNLINEMVAEKQARKIATAQANARNLTDAKKVLRKTISKLPGVDDASKRTMYSMIEQGGKGTVKNIGKLLKNNALAATEFAGKAVTNPKVISATAKRLLAASPLMMVADAMLAGTPAGHGSTLPKEYMDKYLKSEQFIKDTAPNMLGTIDVIGKRKNKK